MKHRVRARAALWAILCLLPAVALGAQEPERLAWTVEELSERVTLAEREDKLPTYSPAAPREGVALYVHRLPREAADEAEWRSDEMRASLLERMDGAMQFTEDPNAASLLVYFEQFHSFEFERKPYGQPIRVYASGARLRVISLVEEDALPTEAYSRNEPGDIVQSNETSGNIYMEMPDLLGEEAAMTPVVLSLQQLCGQTGDTITLGSQTLLPDAIECIATQQRITDITPLARLTELRYLFLTTNEITDITPLAGLEHLVQVELSDNQITDISALAGKTELQSLNLSINNVEDLSPLYACEELLWLELYQNPVSEEQIEALKRQLPGCEVVY